ncbi:hypothetical protein K443DRAFT_32834, partial [Laccaria amethystina LaAM-08-1]
DLPLALLKPAFDVLIPADCALTAAFWALYNNKERSVGMQACCLIWTVTNSMLVPQEVKCNMT